MNEPDEKMDVYSGVRWNAVATFGCQTVRFVTSITLARLLAPEYFGLLAMAEVFVGFAGTFSTMGFSKAIVQRKRISEELLCSLRNPGSGSDYFGAEPDLHSGRPVPRAGGPAYTSIGVQPACHH